VDEWASRPCRASLLFQTLIFGKTEITIGGIENLTPDIRAKDTEMVAQ